MERRERFQNHVSKSDSKLVTGKTWAEGADDGGTPRDGRCPFGETFFFRRRQRVLRWSLLLSWWTFSVVLFSFFYFIGRRWWWTSVVKPEPWCFLPAGPRPLPPPPPPPSWSLPATSSLAHRRRDAAVWNFATFPPPESSQVTRTDSFAPMSHGCLAPPLTLQFHQLEDLRVHRRSISSLVPPGTIFLKAHGTCTARWWKRYTLQISSVKWCTV